MFTVIPLPARRLLVCLSASFGVALAGMVWVNDSRAEEPVSHWRAMPHLDVETSSTNCGIHWVEPIQIEFVGKVVKTTAWTARTYDMVLLEPLKADGSGEVYGVSMPHNHSIVVRFEPGHGPRPFTYWGRYGALCRWTFMPIGT
jgi:hypothetical protein